MICDDQIYQGHKHKATQGGSKSAIGAPQEGQELFDAFIHGSCASPFYLEILKSQGMTNIAPLLLTAIFPSVIVVYDVRFEHDIATVKQSGSRYERNPRHKSGTRPPDAAQGRPCAVG